MPTVWIVSEDVALADTLAYAVRSLGPVWTGTPERSAFRDAEVPDLVVVAATAGASPGDLTAVERLLEFLRGVPRPRRAPQPVIWIPNADADAADSGATLIRQLVDDRPLGVLAWPPDPEALRDLAAEFVGRPGRPLSLRERARQDWVRSRVELLYADLELPELRTAVDPRNAARPVLLIGESGTRRGLLARYIHNLAEPLRDRLRVVPASSLRPGDVEARLVDATAGERLTLFVDGIESAGREVQAELAHLLGTSGALGIEPIRWVASAASARALSAEVRTLPWIRVELPPLRARRDRVLLAQALVAAHDPERRLGDDALALIERYRWPGNLRELEAVIDSACAAVRGAVIAADDLPLGPPGAGGGHGEVHSAAPAEPVRLVPASDETEAEPEVERDPTPPFAGAPVPSEAPDPERAAFGDAPDAEIEAAGPREPEVEVEVQPEPEVEVVAEPDDEPELAVPSPEPRPERRRGDGPEIGELLRPLADEIRQPLLAIRTYANLLDQRPDDAEVRRELASLTDRDLALVDETLHRLERFGRFGRPEPAPFDLAAAVVQELDQRSAKARSRSIVVLRELDYDAPAARADEEQIRFALGALLDRALRMIPDGGDLYMGSLHHPARGDEPARHRLLFRFHSPEEALLVREDEQQPAPLEVVLARSLVERAGGSFAVDSSGPHDNVVLIELPAAA